MTSGFGSNFLEAPRYRTTSEGEMARIKRSQAQRKSTRKNIPLRFRPLSLAVAAAVGSMAGPVLAQETDELEEIVVTGFRGSLMEATRLKMES